MEERSLFYKFYEFYKKTIPQQNRSSLRRYVRPEQQFAKQMLWVPSNPYSFHLPLEVRQRHPESTGLFPLCWAPTQPKPGSHAGFWVPCVCLKGSRCGFEQRGRYEPDIPTVSHKQLRLSQSLSSPPSHFDFAAPMQTFFWSSSSP